MVAPKEPQRPSFALTTSGSPVGGNKIPPSQPAMSSTMRGGRQKGGGRERERESLSAVQLALRDRQPITALACCEPGANNYASSLAPPSSPLNQAQAAQQWRRRLSRRPGSPGATHTGQ